MQKINVEARERSIKLRFVMNVIGKKYVKKHAFVGV